MVEPLLSFFLPKVKTLILLDQPHPVSDIISPIVEVYSRSKLKEKFVISGINYLPIYLFCKMSSQNRTRISYKLRDLFSVIFVSFKFGEKNDLFIGMEAINVLAGLLLKKMGRVKTVIYYVSDYSPTRFGKTLFNALYLWLDRFCVKHADFTWDVSPAMKKGRIEAGISSSEMDRVIHVPNGLFSSQIKSLPISQRASTDLVYMGSLYVEFGSDLAIMALKEVKKIKPNSILRIIGGGEEYNVSRLRNLVKQLNLEDSVMFYGFVADNSEMAKIVRSCYIGLAPYRVFNKTSLWYGWYGDAGKIRQYIASGLPVVTTHVPPLGKYIVEQGAGIMTKDTVKSFSNGIIQLLSDNVLYRKLTLSAEKISKNNTWENAYKQTFNEMERIGIR